MSHRPLVPPLRGFARGTEVAEENDFPFSADPEGIGSAHSTGRRTAEKGKT